MFRNLIPALADKYHVAAPDYPGFGDGEQPLPAFSAETAAQKVRLSENAWNSRVPQKVSLAYTT
jgi:pimeloyl-ACP methyl ester carboxylesterase